MGVYDESLLTMRADKSWLFLELKISVRSSGRARSSHTGPSHLDGCSAKYNDITISSPPSQVSACVWTCRVLGISHKGPSMPGIVYKY